MSASMQSTQRIGFHESDVVGIRRENGMIILELEGVHLGDELRNASIRLTGVKTIIRDGMAIDDMAWECEAGEVLTLKHTQDTFHLIDRHSRNIRARLIHTKLNVIRLMLRSTNVVAHVSEFHALLTT